LKFYYRFKREILGVSETLKLEQFVLVWGDRVLNSLAAKI